MCYYMHVGLVKEVENMFRIPEAYVDAPSYEDAMKLITARGRGDALEGMLSLDRMYDEYVASTHTDAPLFESDDEFYYTYSYELNAYNVVYTNMSRLFAPKEAV